MMHIAGHGERVAATTGARPAAEDEVVVLEGCFDEFAAR